MTPFPRLLLACSCLLALAGCGASGPAAQSPATPVPRASRPGPLLDRRGLEVALGARLRVALRADAVMRQPRGEAADLGQPLPTTLVTYVRCRAVHAADTTCTAGLRSPSGHPRAVRYRVSRTVPSCLAAQAQPALPARFDPTTGGASDDPLGTLSSSTPDCTGLAAAPAARAAGAGNASAGVAAQDPRDPLVPRAGPATLRAPIARYRRHVMRALAAMKEDIVALRRDLQAGRAAAARAAWTTAFARYETIGAAYGAFGALDAAIDGRPGGLAGGVRSARFTGLHRLELALFGRHSIRDAVRPAARLLADVRRLRRAVEDGQAVIAPLDVALRAHEVLEDTASLQLTGRASPWASAGLVATRANLVGTRVLLAALEAPLRRRDPQRLTSARRALARLEAVLDDVAPAGRVPRLDALAARDRARVDAAVADAAEELAYVPALVDPRPPAARTNPFGPGGGS